MFDAAVDFHHAENTTAAFAFFGNCAIIAWHFTILTVFSPLCYASFRSGGWIR